MDIKMRKFNHLINNLFANGLCVLDDSKLKLYETCVFLTRFKSITTCVVRFMYTYAFFKNVYGEQV